MLNVVAPGVSADKISDVMTNILFRNILDLNEEAARGVQDTPHLAHHISGLSIRDWTFDEICEVLSCIEIGDCKKFKELDLWKWRRSQELKGKSWRLSSMWVKPSSREPRVLMPRLFLPRCILDPLPAFMQPDDLFWACRSDSSIRHVFTSMLTISDLQPKTDWNKAYPHLELNDWMKLKPLLQRTEKPDVTIFLDSFHTFEILNGYMKNLLASADSNVQDLLDFEWGNLKCRLLPMGDLPARHGEQDTVHFNFEQLDRLGNVTGKSTRYFFITPAIPPSWESTSSSSEPQVAISSSITLFGGEPLQAALVQPVNASPNTLSFVNTLVCATNEKHRDALCNKQLSKGNIKSVESWKFGAYFASRECQLLRQMVLVCGLHRASTAWVDKTTDYRSSAVVQALDTVLKFVDGRFT
jgi:hypothetical protein